VTALYEAPSHTWYRISCWVAGGFCVTYTLVSYYTTLLKPQEELQLWVRYLWTPIIVLMGGMAAYFAFGATGIVRAINAVPAQLANVGRPRPPKKGMAMPPPPPLYLEVEIRPMLPVLPARKLYVEPAKVVLPFRLARMGLGPQAVRPMTPHEQVLAKLAEQEDKERRRRYEREHIMTAPFRHMGIGARAAWQGIKRGFTKEGFAKIRVNGKNYKLDIMDGWALDDGRALDRLASIDSKYEE